MDERLPNDDQLLDILLVFDKEEKMLRAVSGKEMDKDGNPKTVPARGTNEESFLKIDKHGNMLENFCSNFMRQVKNPTRFEFFRVPLHAAETSAKVIFDLLKAVSTTASEEFLSDLRVNPAEHVKEQQQTQQSADQKKSEPEQKTESQSQGQKNRFDESKIDWEQLKNFGITKEKLQESGTLDIMLKGGKSPDVHPVSMNFGAVIMHTDARLSFRENANGDVVLAIHGIRQQPELDKSFFGHKFTDEDKKNLLSTGNMGRLAETKDFRTGETHLSYISLDRQTNELVAMKAEHIRLPHEIKGVKLTEEQRLALHEGKPVRLEGMTSKDGKPFSASVQINADKRSIEFIFDKQQKQSKEQSQSRYQNNGVRIASGDSFRIPKHLGGVELSKEQQNKLREGATLYVAGMKDRQGQEYNAYIRVNVEKGKLDFFKWNPDKINDITPANKNREQVAANNEGKRSEQTKHISDVLKPGQVAPNEKQKEKQEQKEEQKQEPPKKSKGMKL